MRRLGIAVGVLASAGWVTYIAIISKGFEQVQLLGWLIFAVGIPVSFGIGFLVVWGVDWVIAGFRTGKR